MGLRRLEIQNPCNTETTSWSDFLFHQLTDWEPKQSDSQLWLLSQRRELKYVHWKLFWLNSTRSFWQARWNSPPLAMGENNKETVYFARSDILRVTAANLCRGLVWPTYERGRAGGAAAQPPGSANKEPAALWFMATITFPLIASRGGTSINKMQSSPPLRSCLILRKLAASLTWSARGFREKCVGEQKFLIL